MAAPRGGDNGGAAGANGSSPTLKAVFEAMEVASKLNIPGNASDLELKWTDPADKEVTTITVAAAEDFDMGFFSGLKQLKIAVSEPSEWA